MNLRINVSLTSINELFAKFNCDSPVKFMNVSLYNSVMLQPTKCNMSKFGKFKNILFASNAIGLWFKVNSDNPCACRKRSGSTFEILFDDKSR